MKSVIKAVIVAIALGGCADDGAREPSRCDPFAPSPGPIALGEVLGAGKDARGTYYVADIANQQTLEERVFISEGDVLVRQLIGGSGQSGTQTMTLRRYSLSEREPDLTLALREAGGAVRMAVLEGDFTERTFVIGEDGEELTIVPAREVEDLELRNLPRARVFQVPAELEDGRLLLVITPEFEWPDGEDRVFLGPADTLEERDVYSLRAAPDRGSWLVEFDLDGERAVAVFPAELEPGATLAEPALKVGRKTQALTLLDADDVPPRAEYLCL